MLSTMKVHAAKMRVLVFSFWIIEQVYCVITLMYFGWIKLFKNNISVSAQFLMDSQGVFFVVDFITKST
jgi:hypothetical protein